MEVVTRRSELEEMKDQMARPVTTRSMSVPEFNTISDDSNYSCSFSSDSQQRGKIRPRSISSQGLMRMVEDDDDDDDDDKYNKEDEDEDEDDDDDDEVKVFPNLGKHPASMFWIGGGSNEDSSYYSSSDDDYMESNGMDDLEQREQLCPPQIRGFLGLNLLQVVGRDEKSVCAALLKDVKLALEEYKRQKGVDYEFVKACGVRLTSPLDPEDDSSNFGKHMNFRAKREGLDSSPEYFFASLRDGEVHCCKLSYDANLEGIQHCEHIKCLECGLWTRKKAPVF